MFFQYIALFALVAVVSAQYHQTAYAPAVLKKVVVAEQHAPAQYAFEYSVHDDHTGDIKSQQEHRNGDAVQGQYTLIDADGYRRVVDYTADEHNGFNAVVHREPLGHQVQKVAVPVVQKYVAPVQKYVTKQTYAAPSYHY